jgi:hypothetical protein
MAICDICWLFRIFSAVLVSITDTNLAFLPRMIARSLFENATIGPPIFEIKQELALALRLNETCTYIHTYICKLQMAFDIENIGR